MQLLLMNWCFFFLRYFFVTLPEMLQLREVGFSNAPRCSEDEVKERFMRRGGSARSVFTHASVEANQGSLAPAAGALKLETGEKAMFGSSTLDGVGDSDVIRRLFDIVPLGALSTNTLTTDNNTSSTTGSSSRTMWWASSRMHSS